MFSRYAPTSFCQHVCRIGRTEDLGHGQIFVGNARLMPKVLRLYVLKFSQTRSLIAIAAAAADRTQLETLSPKSEAMALRPKD